MKARALLLALAATLANGCAKFPDQGQSGFGKRITVAMRLDGQVRTGLETGGSGQPYVYIFAIHLSKSANPTTLGPIPVTTPGGNGFVDGDCTHFVLWDPRASPQFRIFQFRSASLNEWFFKDNVVNFVPVRPGDKTLQFEFDLNQLVPPADLDDYKSAQVNLLTMNNTDATGSVPRTWEALGDGRQTGTVNSPFTFRLDLSRTFTNESTGSREPLGDVRPSNDPDLDIVDWSIEVRLPPP
jgi:hypothetical protein